MTIIFWVQWEKNCRSLKNGASSSSEGSFIHLSGPSKDIHYKLNSVTTDRFEKNSDFSFKSSFSNSVVPLQCSTNESYQVSHPEVTRVANSAAVPLSVSTHRNMDFPGMNTTESTADHHTGENNHLYLFLSFRLFFHKMASSVMWFAFLFNYFAYHAVCIESQHTCFSNCRESAVTSFHNDSRVSLFMHKFIVPAKPVLLMNMELMNS